MPREFTDGEGVTWSCVEAYAGLDAGGEGRELARVEGEENLLRVVCTPSGGAQTVRLKLPRDWESKYSDEELLRGIEAQQDKDAGGAR
jgi:hypothetical protein